MKYTVDALLEYLRKNSYLDQWAYVTEDDVESILDGSPNEMDYAYGASKIVLMEEDADFVFKIPFNGQYERSYDEDDYPMDDFSFNDFTGAPFGIHEWDYCETETVVYKMAAAAGLAECFAKTEYAGDVDGYPVYIQEKAVIFNLYPTHHSIEENTHTKERCGEMGVSTSGIDICWITDFIEYHGEEMLKKFLEFIVEKNIGDLHTDNIGYIGDRPVLIDYSDFYS